MRQAALLVALVCLLCAPVVGAAAVQGPSSQPALQDGAPRTTVQSTATQPVLQADNTTLTKTGVDITVQIRGDGAARWNISAKYRLEGENDSAAFETLRQEFEAYQTNDEFSVDVFRAVVPQVSERVGRSMEIREANRVSRIVDHGNNSTGVLSVQFTWTNFSRVTNQTLVVDSFSGTWFGDLTRGQQLTIRPPEGYDTDQVQPGPSTISGGAYVWEGPQVFASGEPTAVFTEAAPPTPNGPTGVSMVVLVGVGSVALLLGAVLVLAAYRGTPDGGSVGVRALRSWLTGEAEDAATDGAPAEAATSEDADADPPESDESGAVAGTVDPDLLSDEERVERLLHEHGGRMKQSKIVEETRWSTAKVSQLLSSMADDDRIEKLRIGRENLISLPDEGIDNGLDE
jgi:hypothetical protein